MQMQCYLRSYGAGLISSSCSSLRPSGRRGPSQLIFLLSASNWLPLLPQYYTRRRKSPVPRNSGFWEPNRRKRFNPCGSTGRSSSCFRPYEHYLRFTAHEETVSFLSAEGANSRNAIPSSLDPLGASRISTLEVK